MYIAARLERACFMGRAGLEPATLGLKVRRETLQQRRTRRKWLQRALAHAAMNCNEMRFAETIPYSHPYSRRRLADNGPTAAPRRYGTRLGRAIA